MQTQKAQTQQMQTQTRAFHPSMDGRLVFDRRPVLVYWELTQACDLACQHCRAEAIPQRHPLELSTEEGKRLLKELRAFGDPPPHVVMTGGDVMHRPDLFELVDYAVGLGLPVSVAPSGTNRLTSEVIQEFKALGVQSMSLSLDGSTAERHDEFRGVSGCFDWTLQAARAIREADLPLQINTLVTADTLPDLPQIYELMKQLEVARWSLFFLVQVGRGKELQPITPAQAEQLFHWLYERAKEAPFALKTTEAMHFRRVAYQRMRLEGLSAEQIRQTSIGRGFGIRDGNGIMFISHLGEVYPSGFLPLAAGSIHKASPVEIYRNSTLFQSLRDPSGYKGKCGRCEFNKICGGSRARAYAATGDPLESDPLCAYQPRGAEVLV
jgi:radical SAM protein